MSEVHIRDRVEAPNYPAVHGKRFLLGKPARKAGERVWSCNVELDYYRVGGRRVLFWSAPWFLLTDDEVFR